MKIFKSIIVLILIHPCIGISFGQTSDSLSENLYKWQLDDAYQKKIVAFDTIIDNFQIFNPADRLSISNTTLGNLGSEVHSNIFFTEKDQPYSDFIFDKTFSPYLLTVKDQQYYFSKKPHFELKYIMGTKQKIENTIKALYTQNINKHWNIGANYQLYSSAGEFQRTKTSLHSYSGFVSFLGERYSMHAAFIRNKFKVEENGGIVDTLYEAPEFAEPRLSAANSMYYKRNFFVSQEYKFGTKSYELVNDTTNKEIFNEIGRVNYIINIENNYRKYSDVTGFEVDTEGDIEKFYDNIYLDSLNTSDSLNLRLIKNTFIWTFKEIARKNIKFRASFGASLENIKYYSFKGYVFIEEPELYNSTKVLSDINGEFGKVSFNLNANYYYLGDKLGNYSFKAKLNKSFGEEKPLDVYLKAILEKVNPLLYEQSYYSNNFIWDNNFEAKINSSFRFGANIPSLSAKFEFAAGLYQNYTYFGENAMPSQLTNDLMILSARLHKNFKFWKFKSVNKAVYQTIPKSGFKNVISLPELSIYHSLFIESHFFKKALFAQIGYDVRYSSPFKALSFMPATGQFYQSEESTVGDYPVISVYMNMNIKSVLLFIKFEHFNGQFLSEQYAYHVNHYPINSTSFKFGVLWKFND